MSVTVQDPAVVGDVIVVDSEGDTTVVIVQDDDNVEVIVGTTPPVSDVAIGTETPTDQVISAVALGPAGLSAYELAVRDGFLGTLQDWLLSLHDVADDMPDLSLILENGLI